MANTFLQKRSRFAACLGDLTSSEFFELPGNNRKFTCYITSNDEWAVLYDGICIAFAYNATKKRVKFSVNKVGVIWDAFFYFKNIRCYGNKKPHER